MKLTSTAFENGGLIPTRFTCDGRNICPPLKIADIPPDAVSLVLIMDDPDVPKSIRKDGIWVHWIVFNIPTNLRKIIEGEEPDGIHGKGTGGNMDYFGPCPPDKAHRYFFKLYALNTRLKLPEGSKKHQVERAMEGRIIEKTELMGRYKRM